jgi:hypothetical protein
MLGIMLPHLAYSAYCLLLIFLHQPQWSFLPLYFILLHIHQPVFHNTVLPTGDSTRFPPCCITISQGTDLIIPDCPPADITISIHTQLDSTRLFTHHTGCCCKLIVWGAVTLVTALFSVGPVSFLVPEAPSPGPLVSDTA